MIVRTIQAVFIFKQKKWFIDPHHLPESWGKEPKVTTKVTLTNNQ